MNAGSSKGGRKLSVIVPTRDRPEKLDPTLAALAEQRDMDRRDYEVIVVDDGSAPPVAPRETTDGPVSTVIRLDGDGPAAARNRGASAARGELLVFVDDDMQVVPNFLASHWLAHLEWPGTLQVGLNRLPETASASPFGRFRQGIDEEYVPQLAGPIETSSAINFCAAANMAIERHTFERLGGFDPKLTSGEDQDLALRHTDRGGDVVYVPAASAIHNDDALGIDSYCRRAERGMEALVRFEALHPDWPDNVERARVNGPVGWGREPVSLSAKKLLKSALMWPPVSAVALRLVSVVERVAPNSRLLDKLYRMLLGARLQRGYRRGLRNAHG
ncbi:MAG: glycosyltransferase family 2 protein [Solirubrobacterales bacterium]